MKFGLKTFWLLSLQHKWSFPLRSSSVNVTKSTENCKKSFYGKMKWNEMKLYFGSGLREKFHKKCKNKATNMKKKFYVKLTQKLIKKIQVFKHWQITCSYWNEFDYFWCRSQINIKAIAKTWKNHVHLQSVTKYLPKSKKIKQRWTRLEDFDI